MSILYFSIAIVYLCIVRVCLFPLHIFIFEFTPSLFVSDSCHFYSTIICIQYMLITIVYIATATACTDVTYTTAGTGCTK